MPSGLPGAGCTTMPLGLLTTRVRILKHDVQRDLLRHGFTGPGVRDLQQDDVAGLELQALDRGLPLHSTCRSPPAPARLRERLVSSPLKAVDALACALRFHDKFTLFHGSRLLCVTGVQPSKKMTSTQSATPTDADVRKVEDGEPHEQQVDVVYDLAVQQHGSG